MKNTKQIFILFSIAFVIILVGMISILANKKTAELQYPAPEQYADRISYFGEWGAQSGGIYATARLIKQGADDSQMWYQIKLISEAEYHDTSSWENQNYVRCRLLRKTVPRNRRKRIRDKDVCYIVVKSCLICFPSQRNGMAFV